MARALDRTEIFAGHSAPAPATRLQRMTLRVAEISESLQVVVGHVDSNAATLRQLEVASKCLGCRCGGRSTS